MGLGESTKLGEAIKAQIDKEDVEFYLREPGAFVGLKVRDIQLNIPHYNNFLFIILEFGGDVLHEYITASIIHEQNF